MTPKKWSFSGFFEKQVPLAKNFFDRKLGDKLPVLSFFGMKKFCQRIGERQILCDASLGVI